MLNVETIRMSTTQVHRHAGVVSEIDEWSIFKAVLIHSCAVGNQEFPIIISVCVEVITHLFVKTSINQRASFKFYHQIIVASKSRN